MPDVNLGYVGVGGGDWNQNDPKGAGYIKNRPCYFTGKLIAEDYASFAGSDGGSEVSSLMTAGDTYRVTINDISVELDAYSGSLDGVSYTQIGDSLAEDENVTPTYGYLIFSFENSGHMVCEFYALDSSMLQAAFGLTADDVESGNYTVKIEHLAPEAMKLDKRLLPDDIGGGSTIKVVDIGGAAESIADMDFSAYKSGDIILVVGDM